MPSVLEVENVRKSFGGVHAVEGVSFAIAAPGIYGLIGPNGAGKTTLFNMIAGEIAPDQGTITFAGERTDGLTPDRICARGIARTFQLVRPFPALSVEDNVVVGALLRRRAVADARAHAREVMHRLEIYGKRARRASELTLPDRKRLEVARALATEPRLLLLDEVMAGLRPTETETMIAILRALNQEGLTVLLIEHVMQAVLALAARVLVLHHGAALALGPPHAVMRDPAVARSYLGVEA